MHAVKNFKAFEKQLADEFSSLTEQEQLFARLIMESSSTIALKSMRELAKDAGVTSYTAIRFFKKMGFEKFDDLKELARSELSDGNLSFFGDEILQNDSDNKRMLATQLRLIMSVVENPDADELDRLAKIFIRSKINYVLGFRMSEPLARHFQTCAQTAHKNMLLISGVDGESIDQFASIGPGDVCFALSFKPYTQVAIRLCQFAKRRGARVVCLTDSKTSPIHKLADERIFVPASGPQYFNSLVAPMIVLERLLTRMHTLDQENADRRLNDISALRRFLDF